MWLILLWQKEAWLWFQFIVRENKLNQNEPLIKKCWWGLSWAGVFGTSIVPKSINRGTKYWLLNVFNSPAFSLLWGYKGSLCLTGWKQNNPKLFFEELYSNTSLVCVQKAPIIASHESSWSCSSIDWLETCVFMHLHYRSHVYLWDFTIVVLKSSLLTVTCHIPTFTTYLQWTTGVCWSLTDVILWNF